MPAEAALVRNLLRDDYVAEFYAAYLLKPDPTSGMLSISAAAETSALALRVPLVEVDTVGGEVKVLSSLSPDR